MQLEAQEFDDGTLITVAEPRIDAAVAIQFKDKVKELSQGSEGRVVLDMDEVNFLDSSGLGAVVAAMKQLGQSRKLELASLTPTVQQVFRLTRMDSVFKIHATAESAMRGLRNAS